MEHVPMDDFFCERLHHLRKQKGVSAREMSLALGQGPGYINNIENRHNLPSMFAFFNICDYFNISPQEFFQQEEKDIHTISHPHTLDELISNLKQLEDDQLLHLNAIAKDMKR